MKRFFMILCSPLLAVSIIVCSSNKAGQSMIKPEKREKITSFPAMQALIETNTLPGQTPLIPTDAPEETEDREENMQSIQVTVGSKSFTATLAENAAAQSFAELIRKEPVVINMSDYSGFEKVGSLGTSLPSSNSSITASAGDIILYNGSQIVVFYGNNSWSYTRLGKIDDLTGWKKALGDGDVTITFSLK